MKESILILNNEIYVLNEYPKQGNIREVTMHRMGSDTAGVFYNKSILDMYHKFRITHKHVVLITDPKEVDKMLLVGKLMK
jgi:hypothetical protein